MYVRKSYTFLCPGHHAEVCISRGSQQNQARAELEDRSIFSHLKALLPFLGPFAGVIRDVT